MFASFISKVNAGRICVHLWKGRGPARRLVAVILTFFALFPLSATSSGVAPAESRRWTAVDLRPRAPRPVRRTATSFPENAHGTQRPTRSATRRSGGRDSRAIVHTECRNRGAADGVLKPNGVASVLPVRTSIPRPHRRRFFRATLSDFVDRAQCGCYSVR